MRHPVRPGRLSRAHARALFRRHGLGLRHGRCRRRPVLLPERPEDLPRHGLLPDSRQRMGAGGDFAAAYVIAHEVGHHVQNVLGILPEVNRRRAQMSDTPGQPALGDGRAAGGLLRRRLGPARRATLRLARTGRHRGGAERRRRRSATTPCSATPGGASGPTASSTAARRSGSTGSPAGIGAATRTPATPSAPPRPEVRPGLGRPPSRAIRRPPA